MTTNQQKHTVTPSANESNSSSNEDSTTDSSSSSEEEEEEEEVVITKPIYISKSIRNKNDCLNSQTHKESNQKEGQSEEENSSDLNEDINKKKQITISKLDHQVIQVIPEVNDNKLEFDGINDTDDINPELEYENWKQRELNRFKRDQDIIKQIELEKEDQLRRK